ncbi:MAG: helix-turn-helix transcriptional regulator [Nitratireductor sp.]|nr:helix-turn-helix transcriptional regulator [Nitratireductor sp.]
MAFDSSDPRAIREALKLTQADMAVLIGISQSRLSRIEANPETMRDWQRREFARLARRIKPQDATPAAEKAGAS